MNMRNWRVTRLFVATLAMAIAICPRFAVAVTWYWDTTSTGLWTNSANWSDTATSGGTNGTPTDSATADVAVFNQSSVNGNETVQLGGARSIGGIIFNNTGSTLIASDGATPRTLTLGSAGLTVAANAGAVTIGNANNPVTIALVGTSAQTWTNNSTANVVTLGSPIQRNAGAVLSVAGSGTFVVTSATNTNGIYGPWATIGAGTSTGYVTVGAGNALLAYSGATAAATAANVTDTAGSVNYDVAAVGTVGAGASFNTLRYTGASGTITGNFTANGLMNVGSGALTMSGNATIGSSRELVVSTPVAMTLSGVISNNSGGSSTLVKTGAGTLTLSNANTFSAATIAGGAVTVTNVGALGSGTVTLLNGGAIGFGLGQATTLSARVLANVPNSSDSVTLNAPTNADNNFNITAVGSGTVQFAGLSGFKLQANATDFSGFTGTLLLNTSIPMVTVTNGAADTVDFVLGASVNPNARISSSVAGGTVRMGSLSSTNSSSILDQVSGTATYEIGAKNTDTVFAGLIRDRNTGFQGALTKVGTGKLTLTYANTYTGTTSVNAGTLQIGNAGTTGALSTSSVITGSAGATLAFNRTNTVTQGTDFYRVIGGSINVSQLGSGTLVLNGTNTHSGTTRINAGTLTASNALALQNSTLDMKSGDVGTISFAQSSTLGGLMGSRNLSMGGFTLSIGNNNQSTIYSGTLSNGSLTKVGTGTLTLSAANAYTGATRVEGGILQLGLSNALSASTAVTVAGGELAMGSNSNSVASFTISSGSVTGSGKLTGSTYGLGGGSVFANLGSGMVNVTGNSTLNGTSDATVVNLNAGTLTLGSGNRFTQAAVAVSGSTGASLTLGGNESFGALAGAANISLGSNTLSINGSGNYSGALSGSGGLTKSGTGTFTISGVNTYTGATEVNEGTLALGTGGSFGNSSTIIVGNAGSTGAVLDLTAKSGTFAFGGGQTLKGGGTIKLAADTVLDVQGTFSPGNSPGLFTYDGGTTLLSGTTIMEIWGTNRATLASHGTDPYYDAVNIINGGILNFNNSVLTLDFNQSFADNSTFYLFTPSGASSLLGTFGSINVTGTAYTGLTWTSGTGGVWTSSATTGGQTLSVYSATGTLVIVPEPASLALAGVGILVGGWAIRRRGRATR